MSIPAFALGLTSVLSSGTSSSWTRNQNIGRAKTCTSRPKAVGQFVTRSCDHVAPEVAAPDVDAPEAHARPSFSSLPDINEVIELAREFELADFRLEENGVTIELSMPGGRGFKDGKLLDIPAPVFRTEGAPPLSGQTQQELLEGETSDLTEETEDDAEYHSFSDGEDESPTVEEADADGAFPSDFCVTSNRVGFFFSGGKNKPPLVNVDDHVKFNQPVCIIEQLGQQYVYLSEVSGTVVKIFVEDGDPVEYGTKVMLIRPD
jgi:biotin carboxyl carrier protein